MTRIHPIEHPEAHLTQINFDYLNQLGEHGFRRADRENIRAVSLSLINCGFIPYYWGTDARETKFFSPNKKFNYGCIDILAVAEASVPGSPTKNIESYSRAYLLPTEEGISFGGRFSAVRNNQQYTDFETEAGFTLISLPRRRKLLRPQKFKHNQVPIDLALLTQKRFDEQVEEHKLSFSSFVQVALVNRADGYD